MIDYITVAAFNQLPFASLILFRFVSSFSLPLILSPRFDRRNLNDRLSFNLAAQTFYFARTLDREKILKETCKFRANFNK